MLKRDLPALFYFFVSIFHIFYSVHQGFNHLTTIAVIQFLLLNLEKLTEKMSKYEMYKNHEKFIQIKTVWVYLIVRCRYLCNCFEWWFETVTSKNDQTQQTTESFSIHYQRRASTQNNIKFWPKCIAFHLYKLWYSLSNCQNSGTRRPEMLPYRWKGPLISLGSF